MWAAMLTQIADKVRTTVGNLLASPIGDNLRPVRAAKEALGTANDLVGRPFCTTAELNERKVAHGDAPVAAAREAAPVMVYFDGKDHRTKNKLEELLNARNIKFQTLDVTDDESTRSWALAESKAMEFPLVFVAGEALGGLHEVTGLDVNGTLKKKVFG